MNIIKGYPPNYKEIEAALHPSAEYMFTYGDDIYWPKGLPIRQDVLAHEEIHALQQRKGFLMSPKRWWKRYINDKTFRYRQELEAFKAQWRFIEAYVADREMRNKLLTEMGRNLSSANYGHIVSFSEAVEQIKKT